MGILKRLFRPKDYFKQKIYCMNCHTGQEVKIKLGHKVEGYETICKKCGMKDKIYVGHNGLGVLSYYINKKFQI